MDSEGKESATVVRYRRNFLKHTRLFELHMEILLRSAGKCVHIAQVAGAYASKGSLCLVLQVRIGNSIFCCYVVEQESLFRSGTLFSCCCDVIEQESLFGKGTLSLCCCDVIVQESLCNCGTLFLVVVMLSLR